MTKSVTSLLDLLDPVTPEDLRMVNDPARRGRLVFQLTRYPSFALPSPAAPALLCGVMHEFGVGEVWMVTGRAFTAQPSVLKEIIRQMRRGIPELVRNLRLHRLHMLVDPARAGTARFAQKVGFQFEARLSCLGTEGQDLDMYLYGRKKWAVS